jgi:hypothetical protein
MKFETVIGLVMAEIERAEKLHPVWPKDLVKASALIAEEAGEEIRAANDYAEKRGSTRQIVIEAVHTAATALRFLKNIERTENNE